jgi:hypothetical protein
MREGWPELFWGSNQEIVESDLSQSATLFTSSSKQSRDSRKAKELIYPPAQQGESAEERSNQEIVESAFFLFVLTGLMAGRLKQSRDSRKRSSLLVMISRIADP